MDYPVSHVPSWCGGLAKARTLGSHVTTAAHPPIWLKPLEISRIPEFFDLYSRPEPISARVQGESSNDEGNSPRAAAVARAATTDLQPMVCRAGSSHRRCGSRPSMACPHRRASANRLHIQRVQSVGESTALRRCRTNRTGRLRPAGVRKALPLRHLKSTKQEARCTTQTGPPAAPQIGRTHYDARPIRSPRARLSRDSIPARMDL